MTSTRDKEYGPYKHERGPAWIAYLWLIWRQILSFGDLNGSDGRPSATKLVAFQVVQVVCTIGVIRAVNGADEAWSWSMFWTTCMVFAVMFGRKYFTDFMDVLRNKNNPPGLDT